MRRGFSIIICCHNSAKKLQATLDAISNLDHPADVGVELIIIDNNSTDNTAGIAKDFLNNTLFEGIVHVEKEIGKSYALQTGFNLSKYQYLIICDDDNWLSKDYLTVALQILEDDPHIGIIGGKGIIQTTVELPDWYKHLENAWAVGEQYEKSGDITDTNQLIWGAGMVLRRKAWTELVDRGFKTFLTGKKGESVTMAGEDSELCLLVKNIGYKLYYDNRLQYIHAISPSRINWGYLKSLWEGFARSQVYFSIYTHSFSRAMRIEEKEASRIWRQEFLRNLKAFLTMPSVSIFLKVVYITFFEDRAGYLPGLEKRRFLYKVKELWRIRKEYQSYFDLIYSSNNQSAYNVNGRIS